MEQISILVTKKYNFYIFINNQKNNILKYNNITLLIYINILKLKFILN